MLSVRTLRNASIALFILATASFIFYIYKIIDLPYLVVINLSIGFIEMGIVLLVINNKMTGTSFDEARVLVPKGKIDDKLITAKTNIFQKSIIPTNPIKDSIFRVSVELSEKIDQPLEFSIMRMCEANTCEEKVDAKSCLNEGMHSINIRISPKEKLNFMFDRDVNVKIFEVEEFYIP